MTRPNPGDHLTHQQITILRFVSHGYSNGAIGNKLYITEDTVKTHMRRILLVLCAHDRAHAVRRGFELQLLQAEDPRVHERPKRDRPKRDRQVAS